MHSHPNVPTDFLARRSPRSSRRRSFRTPSNSTSPPPAPRSSSSKRFAPFRKDDGARQQSEVHDGVAESDSRLRRSARLFDRQSHRPRSRSPHWCRTSNGTSAAASEGAVAAAAEPAQAVAASVATHADGALPSCATSSVPRRRGAHDQQRAAAQSGCSGNGVDNVEQRIGGRQPGQNAAHRE